MATKAWRNNFGRNDDWKKSEEDVIKKYYKTNTDKFIKNTSVGLREILKPV